MVAPSVRILDTDFNLLGEIDNYESLQLTRRFYRAGEFEMHIQLGKQHADQLLHDRVICINNQPHKAALISHREITQDDKGIETLVVRGPMLGGALDRRVTVTESYDRKKGAAETVIKHYVHQHIVDGIYAGRKIPFFVCAPDLQRGKYTPWQTRYEQLDQVIQSIAEWCDIGWLVRLDFDTKKWVFDVTEGQDLTAQQSERPRVIFSHEFDNIQSQQYIDSLLQYKNVGYAGGKGEDEDRVMQMVGGGTGLARREVFLDCSSAEDAIELAEMGEQKLSELKQIQTYNGMVLNTNSFQYEKDWDLGDIVTLQNTRWGLTMDSRITEVKEIYEPASKIEIVLGNEVPTITNFVKQLRNNVKRR
ncbi:siphovirus ReqiPepy6 Gp37-like family protein [Paenibacillus thiaminolyticus]|uniref:siphovirus ReqiPepy6 Gp37-like family protein n=1 Tax=Paenibacillus thiaminolyticus TaxID=49283 RepID=UPI0023504A45|nr:siphovirus ReqiPepy6 Gp37-like family protein [Paenibacillus thiaminolyticus]WCR29710.1 siphovirus ReqiPepy6 Gp37-like family protein [Paenibacillus thiaminolyticus]